MSSINQLNSFNNSFTPSKSNNGVNYAIVNPITEKQKQEFEQLSEDKKNYLGFKIGGAALAVGLGALGLMKGMPKGAKKQLNKLLKSLETKTASLKKIKTKSSFEKIKLKVLEGTKFAGEKVKALCNTTPLKDVIFKKGCKKVKFLEKAHNKITGIFEKIAIGRVHNTYRRQASKIDKLREKMPSFSSRLSKKEADLVKGKLDKIDDLYGKYFKADGVGQRIAQTQKNMEGLDEKVWEKTYGNIKGFVKDKNTYRTFVSEEVAAGAKSKLSSTVNPLKEKINKEIDDILKIFKKSDIDEKGYKKVEKLLKRTNKSFNSAVNLETNKFFDKMRDLKIGSAPTDITGLVSSLAMIGLGVSTVKDKDEKISVMLRGGIPILGSVATVLFCGLALISGGQALALGTLSGLILNQVGVAVDRARKKYKENPPTLADAKNLLPALKEKMTINLG